MSTVDAIVAIARARESKDPAFAAAVDQASANVRDVLDQCGVDVFERNQIRAVLAGVLMADNMKAKLTCGPTALVIAIARYL